ncbi:MAG: PQQ-binding-like beta-propeller repeat protein [Balneolales bacterium]|nr:PQQ-binding-like beta-propeller repeat protein [Balneolales bacterium]
MPSMKYNGLILLIALLAAGCASSRLPSVETTAEQAWTHEFRYATTGESSWLNQAYLSDDGQAIALISPLGFESIDADGGRASISANRNSMWAVYTETARGMERINEQKVNFIYVPHLHAVLEFNYGRRDESVALINLENGAPLWINTDIQWSMERHQVMARSLAHGFGLTNSVGGAIGSEAASQILFPEVYINQITSIIYEINSLLIKTLDGMALISLDTGETLWETSELKGSPAALLYHEPTHSIIFVNDDTGLLQVEGFQFNKELARVDASTGEVLWKSRYNGDIRSKVNGFGDWDDRELDIRLMGDFIMLNFLNVEVYAVEDGSQVFRSTTGADRMLDLIAPEGQVMNFFTFPVSDGDRLFRVKHGNIRLSGIDVEMEAYDMHSGERIWETGRLSSNNNIIDLLLSGDILVAGFDGNGSREGLIAMDARSGEKLWQVDLGRSGLTEPFMWHDGKIWVFSDRRMRVVDVVTGEVTSEFTVSESIGRLQDVKQIDDKIFMLGRSGLAVLNMNDGTVLSETSAPRTRQLLDHGDIIIAMNHLDFGRSTVHAFDRNGELLSSIEGSRNRNTILIAPDGSAVYSLRNNRVTRYNMR